MMTNDPQKQSVDNPSTGAALSRWSRWQDWGRLGLGLWLLLTPFIWSASRALSLTDWIGGLLISAAALWTLTRPSSRQSVWLTIIVAGGLIVLPSLLGYSVNSPAAWSSYITNLTVLLLCAWTLDEISRTGARSA